MYWYVSKLFTLIVQSDQLQPAVLLPTGTHCRWPEKSSSTKMRFDSLCVDLIIPSSISCFLLYDTICKQSAMFMKRRFSSESAVVIWCFCGRMASCAGHTLFMHSKYFDLSANGLLHSGFLWWIFCWIIMWTRTASVRCNFGLPTLELLVIKRGVLFVANISADDIHMFLSTVCTN